MSSQPTHQSYELPNNVKPKDLLLHADQHLRGHFYETHNFTDWAYHIAETFSSLSPELFNAVTHIPGVACTPYHLLKNMTSPLQQKYRSIATTGRDLWTIVRRDYSRSTSQDQCRALMGDCRTENGTEEGVDIEEEVSGED